MTRRVPPARLHGGIDAAVTKLSQAGWFFLGFAAGRDPARDETAGQHLAVEGWIEQVREWLAWIQDGTRRTIAAGEEVHINGRGLKTRIQRDDGGLIVVTFAELERIYDGLPRSHRWGRRGLFSPTRDDQRMASETLKNILDEFAAEQQPTDDEIPF